MAAVGDKVEVYVDGGVRFGTDVFKALALGARAVFVGRPVLWGLTYQVSFSLLNTNLIRIILVTLGISIFDLQ